jgi:hypothetical protein
MIAYVPKSFSDAHMAIIERANEIAESYERQGFGLTLRQLYYQFVARGLIANKDTEYKRLGSIVNDARLAGLIDWDHITDRTRAARGGDGGDTAPEQVIDPDMYAMALWEGQPRRVEVWVEKDALVDIVGQAAGSLRVSYFSCRGYTSASGLWEAARRIEGYFDEGAEDVTILHLGDHDPSGIDMTRDITDRLRLFLDGDGYDPELLEIDRIALNIDQVRRYNPPPNPAKITDSRATGYIRIHGRESWELDALEPTVLRDLIQSNLRPLIDPVRWQERAGLEREGRATLRAVREHYDEVLAFLTERGLA